ncbi:uncharacterized protein LOC128992844 [Macrosteles quadrilineatus]|uniref:uncharacterized protein LOC128992844 n=1 Tax=Macrosteles quadrilineatus TaxID=74068 RepID=UPI0023E0946D|nr:uncharacterized protein LOC128992844 [Macrosteles quadrilineatus]
MNDVSSSISSNFLMFADDMKVFNRVSSSSGHQDLQMSLREIEKWCASNSMELNVSKCVIMSFKRGLGPVTYDYLMNNTILKRVQSVKDLGVVLSPSFSPQEHINYITSRANSLLGFLFRSTKDFHSPNTPVVLYKSLVRPILEYACIIWTPYQQNHIDQLQHIQDRFLRLLGSRIGYTYRATPVVDLEKRFGLLPLIQRRHYFDLIALHKIVNGFLDCPELLSSIDFVTPRGTRSGTIFRRKYHSTYYTYHAGISRLLRIGSDAASHIDFFNESIASFKHKVLANYALYQY